MTDEGMHRREFLRRLLGSGLMLPALGGFSLLSGMRSAAAASQAGDYRALVCLYLHGGNDSFNMVVPRSGRAYERYRRTRGNLSVAKETLLAIEPRHTQAADYGLHPSLEPLVEPFEEGDLAILANLGTLLEPLDAEQARRRPDRLPPQLFSHSDQTFQWQAGFPHASQALGWGGRMADLLQHLNGEVALPMNITLAGDNLFLTGEQVVQYALGVEGPEGLDVLVDDDPVARAVRTLLRRRSRHRLERQFAAVQLRSIELHDLIASALEEQKPLQTEFPQSELGRQLSMVARMIASRERLGLGNGRQVFLVSAGGWDTHDRQNQAHPQLLANLAGCMRAFREAMLELGEHQAVTLFTASEFGRTLTSNGDGSDHGWGGHQLVQGGAVLGGDIYGEIPEMVVGGREDLGDGRIVPATAAAQYSATLARWFGVRESQLQGLFPHLQNFDSADLGFMQA